MLDKTRRRCRYAMALFALLCFCAAGTGQATAAQALTPDSVQTVTDEDQPAFSPNASPENTVSLAAENAADGGAIDNDMMLAAITEAVDQVVAAVTEEAAGQLTDDAVSGETGEADLTESVDKDDLQESYDNAAHDTLPDIVVSEDDESGDPDEDDSMAGQPAEVAEAAEETETVSAGQPENVTDVFADAEGESGTIGEIVDPDKFKFVKGEPELRVVAYYPVVDNVEPEILGGGTLYQGRDEVEVTQGLSYEWYKLINNVPSGSLMSRNELLTLDVTHGYVPDIPAATTYRQTVRLNETGDTWQQDFTVDPVNCIPSFPLTATGGTTAAEDSPVVLTAEIPADYDARVQNSLTGQYGIGTSVTLARRAVRWYPDGYGTVGTNADGQPTLTLNGAAQATTKPLAFRCIIDYEMIGGTRTGVVRAHSDAQKIQMEETTVPPYWITDPDSTDESVVACSRFKYPPVTEAELQNLYRQMILPYYDPTYKNQPFALKAAVTNADGTLSDTSKAQLFNLINFIRRCAGVDPLASIDAQKTSYAQAGTQFMSANNTIGHYAAVGSGNTAADYGLQRSNLSWGKITGGVYDLTEMQLNQFEDDDPTNMATLGHRRWLLDNRMRTTGFGYTGPTAANQATHLATFVRGQENEYTVGGKSLEAYPGIGAFPVELLTFKGWSLGLGDGTRAPATGVRMSVTRDDGKTVELNRLDNPSKAYSARGDWFTVDSKGCGSGQVIIFNPGSMFGSSNVSDGRQLLGHTYTMCITGLTTATGFPSEPVVYSTRFVSLAALTDEYDPTMVPPAAPVIPGTSTTDPVTPSNPVIPGGNTSILPETPVVPTAMPVSTLTPTYSPEETPEPIPTLSDVPHYPPVEIAPVAPSQTVTPAATSPELSAEPSPVSEESGSAAPSDEQPTASGSSGPVVSSSISDSLVMLESDATSGVQYAVVTQQEHMGQESAAPVTVDAIVRSLTVTEGTIAVVTASGEAAAPDALAATGMVVRLHDANGDLVSEHVVIVPYDVLGTGVIDLTQVVRLARAYTGTEPLKGAFLRAGSQITPGEVRLTDLVRQVRIYRARLQAG